MNIDLREIVESKTSLDDKSKLVKTVDVGYMPGINNQESFHDVCVDVCVCVKREKMLFLLQIPSKMRSGSLQRSQEL